MEEEEKEEEDEEKEEEGEQGYVLQIYLRDPHLLLPNLLAATFTQTQWGCEGNRTSRPGFGPSFQHGGLKTDKNPLTNPDYPFKQEVCLS